MNHGAVCRGAGLAGRGYDVWRLNRVPRQDPIAEGGDKLLAGLRAIRAAEQQGPVLLHCLHGADRTGLMVAMYRMLYQHWPRERALDELRNGGYGYHAVWKNIEKYLRRVDIGRRDEAAAVIARADIGVDVRQRGAQGRAGGIGH